MACQIQRKQDGTIDKVLAPNGEPSKLYQDILALGKENIDQLRNDPYVKKVLDEGLIRNATPEELALAAWSKVYTPEFKSWFGDWENSSSITIDGQQYQNNPRIRFFTEVGKKIRESLPKVPDNHTRLWRGNRKGEVGNNPSFTNALEGIALPFQHQYKGNISYIDVPNKDLNSYLLDRGSSKGNEFIITSELAKKTKDVKNSKDIISDMTELYPDRLIDNKPVSKVVDENGEPLLVYHYTRSNKDFHTFKRSASRSGGFFFADDKRYPLELFGDVTYELDKSTGEYIKKPKVDNPLITFKSSGRLMSPMFLNIDNLKNIDPKEQELDHDVAYLEFKNNNNINGIFGKDYGQSFGKTYVVKNPNQIKSLFNQGSFDEQTGNIYQQVQGTEVAFDQVLDSLKAFVNNAGFKVEDLDNYIKNYELRNGVKFKDTNALVDFANNIIAVKEGKEAAFNEETAHLAIELTPKNARFDRILERVPNTELYRVYADTYREIYRKDGFKGEALERQVRLEILGKILASTLANRNQAKENFGSWLVRVLTNLWDKFLAAFGIDSVRNFIGDISTNIENQNYEFFEEATDNQSTMYQTETQEENLTDSEQILVDVIKNKKIHLRKLRERKKMLSAENTQNAIAELEALEAEEGLIKFIELLEGDLKNSDGLIKDFINSDKMPSDLDLAHIGDFIDFYKPSLDQLFGAMTNGRIKLSDNKDINKELYDKISNQLTAFNRITHFRNQALNSRVENTIKDEIDDPNFNIKKILNEPGKDIGTLQKLFGTPRDITDLFTRTIYKLLGKIFYNVQQRANKYGKQLINKSFNEFGIKSTAKFAERDADGKTTGYFLTEYKLGQFYDEYQKIKDQADKLDSEEAKTEIIEKWLQENTERRFAVDYYKLRASLSDQANSALDKVNASINSIMNKYKNEDLTIDVTKIPEEDWQKIKELRIARRHLSNLYNLDGTKKTGTALDVAKELKKYWETYFENIEFQSNMQAFNEALAKVPNDKKKLWYDRNTEIQYTKEFWELFDEIVKKNYGIEYDSLREERLELLRPFRSDGQEIDVETLPETVKLRIQEIDKRLTQIFEEDDSDAVDSPVKFKDIAEIVKTEEYYTARKAADKAGKLQEWIADNHYYDSKGNRKAYSYWTKFQPKDKKYIKRLPTREWSEINPESNWYNSNFDPNFAGLQPKKSKWSNENNYNKLDENEKKYLEYLIKQKHEADVMMGLSPNNRMPQMSQSFLDLMYNRSNLLSGFKELVRESVQKRADDEELFGNPENEYRADGTKVNYVARKFTRPIEKPETISTDILSSLILYREGAINYEIMTQNAAKLENIQEQIGNRKFKYGKRELKGEESNVYKMTRAFMDANLYGIMLDDGKDFKVPFLNKTMNTAKLTNSLNNYVRNNNLIFNTFSILSNLFGGFITSNIDRVIGRYSTPKSNNKANAEFFANIGNVLMEYNSPVKKNKMTQVLEFFNIVNSNQELFDNLDKTAIKRLKPSDVTYFGWNQGGYYLRAVPALAVMFNQRYDQQTESFMGEHKYLKKYPNKTKNDYYNLTSIYDMLEVKDNSISIKSEFKDIVTDDYLAQLNATMIQRVTQIDGNVTPLDRAIAHRDVWWKLVTTHRGWFIDGIARRWKSESKNLLTGYDEVGWHRYFFKDFLWNGFLSPDRKYQIKQLLQTEFWNTLEPHQKEAVYRTLLDMAIVTAMAIIARVINGIADDDEELEFAAYLSNRVLMETSALSPSPMALMELTQIINSPIAGVRQIETLMDIGDIFNGEEIESGKYKGLSKRERLLIKLMPGVKGAYGSQDPGASNKFLKSKALRWLY